MDIAPVYEVAEGNARGALRVDPRFADRLDPYAIARGKFPVSNVLVFDQYMGSRPCDWLPTTFAACALVSGRLVAILREEGFTGWSTVPAKVFSKGKTEIPGYHVFGVTGRCGRIDNARSTQVWRPAKGDPDKKMRTWLGLYFDPATWDGSDIFGPERSGAIFVVKRVKDALEKAKITNMHFTQLTEVERIML